MAMERQDGKERKPRTIQPVRPGQPIARDLRAIIEYDYPQPRWLIPDLLGYECNLMVAAPKTGKSTMALVLALKVARMTAAEAGTALPPTVLYISPDDTDEGGLKERALRLCDGFTPDFGRIDFWFDNTERMGSGLIEQIDDYLDAHPACVAVFVDALFSVLPEDDGGKVTVSDHRAMRAFCKLQERRGVAVTVLHHDNKSTAQPGDRSSKVSGSRGITAGVHSYTILTARDDSPAVEFYRKPRRGKPVLSSFLLDELSIDWEPLLSDPWAPVDTDEVLLSELEAYKREQQAREERKRAHVPGPIETRIRDALAQEPGASPSRIAIVTGLRRVIVSVYLGRMLARGAVLLTMRGTYHLAPVTSVTSVTLPMESGPRESAEATEVTKVTVTTAEITAETTPPADELARTRLLRSREALRLELIQPETLKNRGAHARLMRLWESNTRMLRALGWQDERQDEGAQR